MANIAYVRGKVYWARVLGDPVLNYNKDGKEWKLDFVPNEEGLETIKKLGIEGRLKEDKKGNMPGKFLHFKQSELRKPDKDGVVKKNDPIKVVDSDNKPWDQNTLIGNGSDADVKFEVVDYGAGKFAGIYIRGLRVLKLVPYEAQEFRPLEEDDEFFAKEDDLPVQPAEDNKKSDDLEDDLPF